MAHFLITGGAGFIGSHLADHLSERGDTVAVLDNLSTGSMANVAADTDFREGDIRSADDVAKALEGVDGCFHLAAIASVQQYREGWADAAATNLIGTLNVFEACVRAGIPVVYASSAAIYGDSTDLPLSETAVPQVISGYGADKLGDELHAKAMRLAMGLDAIGLRFFNVYGPRQAPGSPYSGVISIFLDRISRRVPLTVFGDGLQARDFVYVGDVARALACAMDAPEQVESAAFNVCTGQATTILDLIATLAEISGHDPRVMHEPERAGDIRLSLGNPAGAEAAIGFRAEVGRSEGLRRTWEWFQTRP